MVRSNLSVLYSAASRFPNSPVFKTPNVDAVTGQIIGWTTITYNQFKIDVEEAAKYWARQLSHSNIQQRSVVGVWIGGFSYIDVLHIYGLTRAGYVPQMFSIRLPNAVVICELLSQANAKAIIYDPTFEAVLNTCPVPAIKASSIYPIPATTGPLPHLTASKEDDLAFIFHTSGSTAGCPKLVPCTYRWVGSMIDKSFQASYPISTSCQDVTTWMGSMCHIAQSFMLLGSLQHGACTVQPSVINFSSDELVDMILRCGLNRLNQFASFLANHIRRSHNDSKLLYMLSNLDEVLYSGLPLNRDEEEFAYSKGIKIRNLFGSTECGAMLRSMGGNTKMAPLLLPFEGVSYDFRLITPDSVDVVHKSTARLFELVILKESPDCPDISLRHEDGDFHTGDLFQQAEPGHFVFRGRDDDWIKSENSLRCDTKTIEDNVRETCEMMIQECVVVGNGRPSPVLFVEPFDGIDHAKLKKEIIRRTRHFHSRRYLHERITSANMIVIVPAQTLPRTVTKGNIRRKAVEETFKTTLDQIYGTV